jgi:purine nucleosidase
VKNKLNQIIIFGGSYSKGNITPSAEFNIYSDPEAAENVCNLLKNQNIDTILLTLDLD